MANIRADHVAGAAFIALGLAVFAMSGDLPMGGLSMPGSGFLPKIVAALLILFGIVLALRAGESDPLSRLEWSDAKHAGLVIVITAVAIAAYTTLGFILAMALMMFAFLIIVERRNVAGAAAYSVAVTLLAYMVFDKGLKAPLPLGPFGF
jgi:tripartite tricarboxylate transporter TctB family protein